MSSPSIPPSIPTPFSLVHPCFHRKARWLARGSARNVGAILAGGAGGHVVLFALGCAMAGTAPRVSPEYPEQVVGRSMDRPALLMVGGLVTRVEPDVRSLTIQTPMKLQERIRFDDGTEIDWAGASQSWAAVRPGTPVKIDNEIQADGGVLAKRIAVGQSVGFCSCGPDCRCPPSRGCRVIRVSGDRPES